MAMSSNGSQRIAVVIPAYREAKDIDQVVRQVRQYIDAVIVVDDCSPDETSSVAKTAGAIVVRHDVNCGKGAALKTAFVKLKEMGYTHGITLDGDGQHDPEQLPAFIVALQEPGVMLVLGNRFANPRGMPLVRRMVNASMSWLISRICRCAIPDSQCGYRGIAVANDSVLAAQSNHYDYETEVLILTARAKGLIRSVPVRTIYRGETSKIRPIRDTVRFFKLLYRI